MAAFSIDDLVLDPQTRQWYEERSKEMGQDELLRGLISEAARHDLWLRAEIQKGYADIEAGRVTAYTKDELMAYMEDVKIRGRRRLKR